ncbi:hypothetical protein QUF76_03170 [Desulfobacterales bacterium HSG16]|nr:hypothetical protein [Desulfobacterales bacterium HSG16]
MISEELFESIFPLVCGWAKEQEEYILARGRQLTSEQAEDAELAGVLHPDRIRILVVQQIPMPEDPMIREIGEKVDLVTTRTSGMTLGYGIYIRSGGQFLRDLIVHEFTHTAQYERLGGIDLFLRQYLTECLKFGYNNSPLELEAERVAMKICNPVLTSSA